MSDANLNTTYVPGRSRGLADVLTHRYLLKLLVRKEIKVRYRGSVLGLIWSYVKPAVQFLVYYIALGVFLGLDRGVPNFPIYLFAGIIVINFFTESIRNSTRSIIDNSGLINKIYLPRELFPVASVWVSAIHFFPQVLVLILAIVFITGWQPTLIQLGAGVLGFIILVMFSLGLGMLFGAVNVLFRDSENFVELISMVATWASPVLYLGAMVKETLGDTVYFFYQLNPITTVVELFHFTFWLPTTDGSVGIPDGLLAFWLPIGFVTSVLTLALGQLVFFKISPRFAQEL